MNEDINLAAPNQQRRGLIIRPSEHKPTDTPIPSDLRGVAAWIDDRLTHDRASLEALGGTFYQIGDEEWCDTAIKSWRKEGEDLWVCRG